MWPYPIGFEPKAIINFPSGPILHDFNLSDPFYKSVQMWPYPIGFEPKAIINFPSGDHLTCNQMDPFFVWFPSTECRITPKAIINQHVWIEGPSQVQTGDLLICSQMLYHWAMDPFCMISTLVIPSIECRSNGPKVSLPNRVWALVNPSTECRSKSVPTQAGSRQSVGSLQKQSWTNMYK